MGYIAACQTKDQKGTDTNRVHGAGMLWAISSRNPGRIVISEWMGILDLKIRILVLGITVKLSS